MKKNIFFTILIAAILLPLIPAKAQDKKFTAKQFLKIAQHPPGKKTWAQLQGKATHERKKAKKKESPVYFGVRFTPEQTFAELTIGEKESYSIGQSNLLAKDKVTIIPAQGVPYNPSILKNYGIRPDDLTMSFLFWELVKELEADSFAGQACRVFLLRSPDKNETAKAYISTKYFFPLKVEWTRKNEDESYRSLEVSSFQKVNNLWVIDGLLLTGPGWRTKVEFEDCKAGLVEEGTPKDLFRNIQ